MNVVSTGLRPTWAGMGRFALASTLWLARAAHAALFGAGAVAAFAVWFLGKPGMLDGATAGEVQLGYFHAVAWGSVVGLFVTFYVKGPKL